MEQPLTPSQSAPQAAAPTIRIARTGTFTSNEGVRVTFDADMLAAAAAAYRPEADPAPLVVGHPALDDPAYGWVAGLAVDGDALVATPERVEPSFAELVRAGRYAKVSARFYPPDHPANPAPGAWYLKHIGFLGAAAPGIKGLGTVQFADGADEGAVTLDFNHEETPMSQSQQSPAQKPPAAQEVSFAEREAAIAEREQQIAARETELAAREAAEQASARAARHAANVSFAESLVAATKLAPAGKVLVVGLLDHVDASAVVSFGEDVGELTPADALRQLLNSGAPLIDLGERGGKPEGERSYTSFAAPEGYQVDPERADLFARAQQIQDANPALAWMDCVRRAESG